MADERLLQQWRVDELNDRYGAENQLINAEAMH